MWMAVRDMDIAAELMGIRLLPTKLLAFAVSSFYCGVPVRCWFFSGTAARNRPSFPSIRASLFSS
jgi:branched-chain amino acid transport system permease protein